MPVPLGREVAEAKLARGPGRKRSAEQEIAETELPCCAEGGLLEILPGMGGKYAREAQRSTAAHQVSLLRPGVASFLGSSRYCTPSPPRSSTQARGYPGVTSCLDFADGAVQYPPHFEMFSGA